MIKIDDNIFIKGDCGTVSYAIRTNGSMPAKNGLKKMKKRASRKHARLEVIFEFYARTGRLKYCDGYTGKGISKFKPSDSYPYRVPFFKIDADIYLTHVFKKPQNKKLLNEQIDLAVLIKKEHLSRK